MNISEIKRINQALASFSPEPPQIVSRCKIDTFHLAYTKFDNSFTLPGLSLEDVSFVQAQEILGITRDTIPHMLSGTNLLPQNRPTRDTRQMHFVKELQYKGTLYLYIFRLHLDYMGGASKNEIVIPASQGVSPTFKTDRFYYQARIVPVLSIHRSEGQIVDFTSAQIKDTLFKVSSMDLKRDFWSSVLFDEVDFTDLNAKFCDYFKADSNWQPGKIFTPFVVDYLTLCLNLVNQNPLMIENILPYFHEGYHSFLANPLQNDASDETKTFWSFWYASFKTSLAPAKSGNPHWNFDILPES